LSLFLYGCPPQDLPLPDELNNEALQTYITLDIISYDRVGEEDVIIFKADLEYKLKTFDLIYIKGNGFEVNDVKIYGKSLDKIEFYYEDYFIIDIDALDRSYNYDFYFIVYVDKEVLTSQMTYLEYLGEDAKMSSFNLVFKEHDKNEYSIIPYKFYLSESLMFYKKQNFTIYNDLNDFLTNSYYSQLYLPFNDEDLISIVPEIFSYNDSYHFSMIRSYNYMLYIRTTYNDCDPLTDYQTYTYNNINFKIVMNNNTSSSIHFCVPYNDLFIHYQYYYGKNHEISSFLFIQSLVLHQKNN